MPNWSCVAAGLTLVLLTRPLPATTWEEATVEDPIFTANTCSVHEWASYGDYIYSWPSKYDFVFWPLTDGHGIWHCETSGFTAFIDDFEGLSDQERVDIAVYLVVSHDGESDLEARLKLLEGTYARRDKDPHFDNQLLRVLARWYQELGQLERANEYRRQAFEQIKEFLDTDLAPLDSFQYLYLAANYARQFGQTADSDQYLAQLEEAIEGNADPELESHVEWLSELARETKLIEAGGHLDPVIE